MPKTSVLIHGATGETGGDILEGILEDGSFEIAALVRPQSAEKPAVKELEARGIKIIVADTAQHDAEDLTQLIHGYDIIISAVAAEGQLEQLILVDAAAKVGTKRFVPCGFTTISPPGGVMDLRNQKEQVYQRIWYHHISWPELPLGRLDYAKMLANTTIYGDGNASNILTDKRDIGRFVARIVKDDRTLNKRVFTYSDQSDEESIRKLTEAKEALEADLTNILTLTNAVFAQYIASKYVRQDNTLENSKYLSYVDARELYPDFKPISFSEFVDELLVGKAKELYATRYAHLKKS
ncbi:isoflavone reductase family protein [Rhexocercosporidium sp. MPI-PUGE-AT-0058]|nr:isoflavone reductase family protein [Rhexocercosporidium sp. MPI-PUGE-AT-0058]